jgi:uncharacterized protein YcbK (DUF882 family)
MPTPLNKFTDEQLSPHFKKSEFNQSKAPLSMKDFKVDPKLVMNLETLRKLAGNKPVKVNSGFRTPEYNAKVGGAKKSQHMSGKAADIEIKGMKSKDIEPLAKKAGFTYTQTYPNKPHLHVDVR